MEKEKSSTFFVIFKAFVRTRSEPVAYKALWRDINGFLVSLSVKAGLNLPPFEICFS
jgi:hypothetical protein